MKKSILTLTVILVHLSLFAQYEIGGLVLDETAKPLEFANVLLYQLPDTTMLTGTTTERDGQFKFEDLEIGNYLVKVMMLGYEDQFAEPIKLKKVQTKGRAVVRLKVSTATLSTVEVTAKVPLLEQRSDRMVVNVEESLTSVNGSLMEILKKVPGVIISNGRITLAGNSNPTILINGRTTKYMDINALIREMPGDNIQKIEVIHQPGAEFEAAGTGPIINIILKSNKLFGTNGSIQMGVGKATFWRYNGSFSINHRQGDLNFYGGAGYSHNAYNESLLLERVIENDRYSQINQQPSLPYTTRANFGLDWYINDKHTLGFSGSGLDSDNNRTWNNNTIIRYSDAAPNSEINTDNRLERNWSYLTAAGYYTFKIDTMGQKLDFNLDFATFDRQSTSFVETRNIGENVLFFNNQRTNQPGTTDIYALRLDYNKPFNKNVTLALGGKYSIADLDNDLLTESFDNETWVTNLGLSNHFIFDEDIVAGYGKLTAKAGDWEFTGGLRYEESQSKGYSVTLDSTTSRTISRFFPSASIGKSMGEKLGFALAYSYRIDRPSYRDLNPFVLYLDPYTLEKGNPQLLPELTHSAKFSLTYEKQPFFNLEYLRSKNEIAFVTEQDDVSGATIATTVNLDKFEKYGGSLFFPLDFVEGLSGYGGVLAYYNKFDSEYLNDQFQTELWSITAFLQANLELPFDIQGEIGGWYTNGGQDGIINYEHLYGVSLGFERKFLDDKLSLNFSVEDLLFRYFIGNINYANVFADIDSRWDTQIVNFRMTWRFGNQHLKKSDKRRSGASDEINRAQTKN